jgi:hypothetical protein
MDDYKLAKTYLKVNNLKYYRSHGINLADVGEMKNSLFSVNRIDAQSNIPAPKVKVKYGESITMNSHFASDLSANFSYNGISGSAFRKQLTKGDLKLVRYYMSNRDIENGIEDSPKLIESIRSMGRDARVVSDVWVVVDGQMYSATKGGGKFNYQMTGSGKARLKRETTVDFGDTQVLAYMLQKIDWKEKQKKNWSKIDKLIEDPKGL